MGVFSIEHTNEGILMFKGELNYATVSRLLWKQNKFLLATTSLSIQINLSGVTHSDTTGVALLVAWVKQAKKQNKSIQLTHIPEQMRAIIRVSGLENLLPI